MRTIRCTDQLRSSYPRHLADGLPQPARMSSPRTDSPGAIPDISPPDRTVAERTDRPPLGKHSETGRHATTSHDTQRNRTIYDQHKASTQEFLMPPPPTVCVRPPKRTSEAADCAKPLPPRHRTVPPPHTSSRPPPADPETGRHTTAPHDMRRTHGRRLRDSPQRNAPPTVYIRQAQRTIRPTEQLTENLPNLSAESTKRMIRATRQPCRRTVSPRYTSPRPLRKTSLPGGGKTKRRRAPCYGHPSRYFSRRKTYFRIGGRNFPAGHELLGEVSAGRLSALMPATSSRAVRRTASGSPGVADPRPSRYCLRACNALLAIS